MQAVAAPEKLDAQVIDLQRRSHFPFLQSLLRLGGGWFANHALQQPGHRGAWHGQQVAIHASRGLVTP